MVTWRTTKIKMTSIKPTGVVDEALRPTSISVVLVGDVRVCQVRMLFINTACAQGESTSRRPKLLQVEYGLYVKS